MMAGKIIILVALMNMATGQRSPDPDLNKNGSCPNPKKSCSFGGVVFPHNDNLTETCMELQCNEGIWEYSGKFHPHCGECKVEGDPHIHTYDNFLDPDDDSFRRYLLNKTGEYVITQPGFSNPALFGVTGTFDDCTYLAIPDDKAGICIRNINYYEPGIHVRLEAPPASIAASCVVGTPARDPDCDIKVLVNWSSIGPVGNSVQEVFGGVNGPILVFKHTFIDGNSDNLNCMAIVGTKGFSVSLCEYYTDYPYFYVWPMPSLKSPPRTYSDQLYGLCGTWTGNTAETFVLQNQTSIPSVDCLTYTDGEGGAWDICDAFSQSWNNGCCPKSKKSCSFGGVVFSHDDYLTETCMELQCNEGIWEYSGNFHPHCGNCTFGGEPIVYPFDPLFSTQSTNPSDKSYWIDYTTSGEFVMAQPNFDIPAEFYVTSHFINNNCTFEGACVEGVTYHELGITITMILPPDTNLSGDIKVSVNDEPVTIGNTTEYFYGTGGAILVIKHNHIITILNVYCITIVGSKGFTVTLCERAGHDADYPWAYILAKPSLQSIPSQLLGLCNTWTRQVQDCFTDHNSTTCVQDWYAGPGPDGSPQIYDYLVNSWKVSTSPTEENTITTIAT